MKTVKRIGALAMALCLVLALGVTALAADPIASAADLTTATFNVTYTPESGVGVAAKTFTYTVAPSDKNIGGTPIVYQGVGSMTVSDVAFAANDASTSKTATITLPTGGATTFTHAGIYRYAITQAALTDDEVNAGILTEKGTGDAVVKYLDLFVNKDGKILTVVMTNDAETLSSATYTSKSNSFANTFGKAGVTDTDGPGVPTNSGKHTITLTKTVTGDMGDTNEAFAFTVKVTDKTSSNVLTGVKYTIGSNATYVIGTEYDSVISLKSGETATIIVPNDVDVEIKEMTSATEGYKITSVATNGWDTGATTVTDLTTADTGFKGSLNNANATAQVDYTNNRDSISPTGVILRVAPLVILLGASIVFYAMSRKRKENEA